MPEVRDEPVNLKGLTYKKWLLQVTIFLNSRYAKSPEDYPDINWEAHWQANATPIKLVRQLNS
jgi:hypothetical protein